MSHHSPSQADPADVTGTAVKGASTGAGPVLGLAWYALLLATPVLLMVPLEGDAPIMRGVGWLGAYPAGVATRVYEMIRIAMPWLVMGLLLTLVLPRRSIQQWAAAAAAGAFLAGWVVLPAMGWDEVKEILFALPGLAVGVWVGERTGRASRPGPSSAAYPAVPDVAMPAPVAHSREMAARGVSGIHEGAEGGRAVGRAAASLLAVAVLASLLDFPDPRFAIALGIGLLAFATALFFFPRLCLLVVPAALPLLDLAPWTGRFFWDEFDLLMLVAMAVALWQGRFRISAFAAAGLAGVLVLFVLTWLTSLLTGLLPLQPLDLNAFSAYWSNYNSLRVAKGLIWGLVFFGLYRSQPAASGRFLALSAGMAAGVLGVSLWALWEQALFAGAATTADYRVTAGFSSMHTGGGHIEAQLVIALPFVWGLIFLVRRPVLRALAGSVFLLGAYAMFATVARGGLIALAGALLILIAGSWLARRGQAGRGMGRAVPLGLGLATLVVMAVGVSGDFWHKRLEQTAADAWIRINHWSELLSLRDPGVAAALIGQGLGTVPATTLVNRLPAEAGSYRYASEGGNAYLALNSAGNFYMAQRVPPAPAERLRLELSVRAPSSEAGLEASLCEKVLFNSLRCQWLKVGVANGEPAWQAHIQSFDSGEIGAGDLFTRRPVQFSLYNPVPGTVVEVDNVRLLNERGDDLLRNGDFTKGGDFWFFKSGDHLFWHAKNLWVHLLFEQGWMGLILFNLILLLALVRLARAVLGGSIEATVLLAATGAWIIVGGVDSLVDAPRIALLVYAILLIGAAWGAEHGPRDASRSRRSQGRSRRTRADVAPPAASARPAPEGAARPR